MAKLKKQVWISILLILLIFTNTVELSALAVNSSFQNTEFISILKQSSGKKLNELIRQKDTEKLETQDQDLIKLKGFLSNTFSKPGFKTAGKLLRDLKEKTNIDFKRLAVYSLLALSPVVAYKTQILQNSSSQINIAGNINCKTGLVLGTTGSLLTNNPMFLSVAGINCIKEVQAIELIPKETEEKDFLDISNKKHGHILQVPPEVANPITNQTALIGEYFEFIIPDNTFTDVDGDSLTYSVILEDGSPLPDWLELKPPFTPFLLGSYDTPGNARGVTVIGNTAYVADSGSLQIIDVSDPAAPILLGNTPERAFGVTVIGSTAYAASSNSLKIIDVSDPTSPILLGSYGTPKHVYGLTVVDSTAYLALYSTGIQIIDVSNPATPILLGSYDTQSAYGVAVIGNTAYIADSGSLQIIDVSDRTVPIFLGSYTSSAIDVTVIDNTAYVEEWMGGFKIIDVSDPTAPILLGSSGGVRDVTVIGSTAYVADYDDSGLQIIDVSDPATPILLGRCDTPGQAYGVAVIGSTAYVADDDGGLQIIGGVGETPTLVGTPSSKDNPVNIKVTVDDGNGGISSEIFRLTLRGIGIQQAYTYIEETNTLLKNITILPGDTTTGKVNITLSDPVAGTMSTGTSGDVTSSYDDEKGLWQAVGTIADINTLLSSLYFMPAENYNKDFNLVITYDDEINPVVEKIISLIGITVNDEPILENPINNRTGLIGELFTFNIPHNTFIDPDGDRLSYMFTKADDTPFAGWLDGNKQYNTELIGSYETTGSARGITVSKDADIAYVADGNSGVQILDISDPAKPVLANTYDTPGFVNDIKISEKKMYIADGSTGLIILDITEPQTPVFISDYDTTGALQEVAVFGNNLYLADHVGRLKIIDVSNPNRPVLSGTYTTSGYAYGIDYYGGRAYVVEGGSGLEIIDVSDPENSELLGSYDTLGSAKDVIVSGLTAYIANEGQGLEIVNVSNPANCTMLGSYDTPGTARRITFFDDKIYLADDIAGIHIIDVSNSTNPVLLKNYTTTEAWSIKVAGNYGYIADGGAGIKIVEGIGYMSSIQGIPSIEDSTEMIKVTATDGRASSNSIFKLTLAGISVPGTYFYLEDTDKILDNLVIKAGDNADATVKISLSDVNAGILSEGISGEVISSFNNTEGAWEASGNVDNINILLDELYFRPDTNYNDNFNITIEFDNNVNPASIKTVRMIGQGVQAKVGENLSFIVPEESYSNLDQSNVNFNATLEDGSVLPDWLNIIIDTGELSGTPAGPDRGTIKVKVTAEDIYGKTVTNIFEIKVPNTVPILENPIEEINISVEESLDFIIPVNTFSDIDGDTLSYTASLEDGSDLPDWLSFNEGTKRFSGTPAGEDRGTIRVKLTANDNHGGSLSTTFDIGIENSTPMIVNPIGDKSINTGGTFNFTIPSNTFSDADGDSLSYSVGMEDGNVFPGWLSYDEETKQFIGEPASGDQGTYRIKVEVDDGYGGIIADIFDIEVPNRAPILVNAIGDQTIAVLDTMDVVFAENMFEDVDQDTMTYIASLSNGDSFPGWLQFNGVDRRFSGTPTANDRGIYLINVRAEDGYGGSTSHTFSITVPNTVPAVFNRVTNMTKNVGHPLFFQFPADTFIDIDEDPLTYSASLNNGDDLPGWLTFLPESRLLSGTPLSGNQGTYIISITADDGKGGSITETFSLTVPNIKPVLLVSISDQSLNYDQSFGFIIPENTFTDADSDTLSYSAYLEDGSSLPDWVTFDSASRRLSAMPGKEDGGTYRIGVKATDGIDDSLYTYFYIRVEVPPRLVNPISNNRAKIEEHFTFFINQDTFEDLNNDLLSYKARLSDSTNLPSWLQFNPLSGTFSGMPLEGDKGIFNITIIADDRTSGTAETSFLLEVDNRPILKRTIKDQSADIGNVFTFTFDEDTFEDADEDILSYTAVLANGGELPEWLSFNNITREFTGTPQETDTGEIEVKVTAEDSKGGRVSTGFMLTTEHFPERTGGLIGNQIAEIGKPFELRLLDRFTHPDGKLLTFRASGSDGSDLPAWLNFDPFASVFSGTPQLSDLHDEVELKITAIDEKGGSVSSIFKLLNINPVIKQSVIADREFKYVLDEDIFGDKFEGLSAVYSATLSDGRMLPSWLNFDQSARIFSGVPTNDDLQELNIKIIATNGEEALTTSFKLEILRNERPILINSISDQHAKTTQSFEFTIPDTTFADPNGDDLAYRVELEEVSASLINEFTQDIPESKWPEWLTFDPVTRQLSGTPEKIDAYAYKKKIYNMKIIASDKVNEASTSFNIILSGPSVTETILTTSAAILSGFGTLYKLRSWRHIPWNLFKKNKYKKNKDIVIAGLGGYMHIMSVKAEGIKLIRAVNYKKRMIPLRYIIGLRKKELSFPGGALLPEWLEYNPQTNILRSKPGKPTIEDIGEVTIQVIGRDNRIREQFEIEVKSSQNDFEAIVEQSEIIDQDIGGVQINPSFMIDKDIETPGGSEIAYAPNGKTVASGGYNGSICILDVMNRQCLQKLQGHGKIVNTLVYSPDGSMLASGSADNTIQIWELDSGRCLKILKGHNNSVNIIEYSPDGKRLASGSSDKSIRIWDIDSGKCIQTLQGHNGVVNSVVYSPDGKSLASGSSDKSIRIWDIDSGECIQALQGHNGAVKSVACSPDGKSLASGSSDKSIRIWNINKGKCSRVLDDHTGDVNSLAYSQDGTKLISGSSDKTICIWDIKKGKSLTTIEEEVCINSVAYSSDGMFFASGGKDQSVKIWKVEETKDKFDVKLVSNINQPVFLSDPNAVFVERRSAQPAGLFRQVGEMAKPKYFGHSYTSVTTNLRAKDKTEIDQNIEYEIEFVFTASDGLSYKIADDKQVDTAFIKKLDNIVEDLMYRININDILSAWLLKEENSKFVLKVTNAEKGTNGLGQIDKDNNKTFYVHGALFLKDYKEDITSVISYVILTELLRMIKDLENNESVLSAEGSRLVELYKELFSMFTESDGVTKELEKKLIREFTVLEEAGILITEIDDKNIKTSDMLKTAIEMTDDTLMSFLATQECA